MNLRYDEEAYEPVADFSGNRLELGIESRGGVRIRRDREAGDLSLELARGVPMRLDLEFGAVRADLDLGGLHLTALDVSTGASKSTIDISEPNRGQIATARFEVGAAEFAARHLGNLNAERIEFDAGVGSVTLWLDGDWQRDMRLSIDMGIGALELRVPEGLGIQLRKDSFLTSLDSEGLVKRSSNRSIRLIRLIGRASARPRPTGIRSSGRSSAARASLSFSRTQRARSGRIRNGSGSRSRHSSRWKKPCAELPFGVP
jgi:hypothetical protein